MHVDLIIYFKPRKKTKKEFAADVIIITEKDETSTYTQTFMSTNKSVYTQE
jgi:hypothetical protein